MAKVLTVEAVDEIMKLVLFKADEVVDGILPPDAIVVDGLVAKFAFHPVRLKEAAPKISALLGDLPNPFHLSLGGGWSFLNGCVDKAGEQWGEQRDVEHLVCLGIGIGAASWMMREMADALPGGVPYFEVHPEIVAPV